MKKVVLKPTKVNGDIMVPPSKSFAHRAIICAALSEGKSKIGNIDYSVDINSTIDLMRAMGAEIETKEDNVIVNGFDKVNLTEEVLNCNESGSTIRFLIPVAITQPNKVTFTGKGKLITRPQTVYYNIFDKQGIKYETTDGHLPLTIDGVLKSGKFEIPGDISSQFISGLLFSLPKLEGNSEININGVFESKSYVDLTLDMLKRFGIEIEVSENQFKVKGNQTYKNNNYNVEGDFSQAAFWIVAGLIGEKVVLKGMNKDSLQGDKAVLDIVERMGGKLDIKDDEIVVYPSKTKGTVIDVSQCPDIGPILAVLGSLSEGETRIINAARLRIKECDRITATVSELSKLGADIREEGDSIIIQGKPMLKGTVTDSWNDHRIAMSMAVASIRCEGEVTVNNSTCVKKSYPGFWKDFAKMGGNVDEYELG